MARRPRIRTPYPVPAVPAGSWRAAGGVFRKLTVVPAVPVRHFTRRERGPIAGNGISQGIISGSGAASVSVGPSGLGTRWYPQSVAIATKTGAADASTATVYLGAVVASNIVGQSYAGGGDSVGLAVPMMQPGDLLTVVWASGHPGDWASIQVVGDLEALVM